MIKQQLFEFHGYRLDVSRRRLSFSGTAVKLNSKALDVLIILVSHAGSILNKDELMDAVWPDTAVEENNLTQQISTLRRTFGERAGEGRLIATVPGRGYCFVADVSVVAATDPSPADALEERPTQSSHGPDRARLIGVGYAFALIAFVGSLFVLPLFGASLDGRRDRTVVVLDLRSAAGESDAAGAGISETLRARLGSVSDLTVRPAHSLNADPIAAGRDANSDVVLTGSVQHVDGRLRVALEIVDTVKGSITWGGTFDDRETNSFHLQDEIAAEVIKVLASQLPTRPVTHPFLDNPFRFA